MQALRDKNYFLIHEAPHIEKTIRDGVGYGWYLYAEDGSERAFVEDDYYQIVEFDPSDKPGDYEPKKYFYKNDHFEPNGNWTPEKTVGELVKIMQSAVEALQESLDDKTVATRQLISNVGNKADEASDTAAEAQEALCDIDETYNARIADLEEAICELSAMLS